MSGLFHFLYYGGKIRIWPRMFERKQNPFLRPYYRAAGMLPLRITSRYQRKESLGMRLPVG